jgi:Cu-processing system permease protein
MLKISKYIIYDIIRSKVLIAYTVFLLVASIGLFSIEENASKSFISLMSIVMVIVPLVSIVFSTTYFYNAGEFMELLVAQPLARASILLGEYLGVALSMVCAFLIGIGIPVLIYAPGMTGIVLITSGTGLTLVFTSLAFFSAVSTRDKARGIGVALMIWFYFAVLYDGIVLAILFAFNDYPLEKAVIALASFNPIDLGRIIILLKLDISALMGFTGAVYKNFFGSNFGLFYSLFIMLIWVIIPLLVSIRIFKRKNL